MQPIELKPLSWHEEAFQAILGGPTGLPHALLLTGIEGIGKGIFARAMAARLLCEQPAGAKACGACAACRWFAAGNHPDFRYVVSEAEAASGEPAAESDKRLSRQIRIDQIRDLDEFVFLGGHRGGARVCVIEPAEAMNSAAANSLLKILEEPPANVYFILISSQPRRLLATLRSRCRIVKLRRPAAEEATRWLHGNKADNAAQLLSLMSGAPLKALDTAAGNRGSALVGLADSLAKPGDDPLALAGRWETLLKRDDGLDMATLVAVLQKWVFDLSALALAGKARFLASDRPGAAGLAKAGNVTALLHCYNALLTMRALAAHPLNTRLFLEEAACRYLQAVRVAKP